MRALLVVVVAVVGCGPAAGTPCDAPPLAGSCSGRMVSACEGGEWTPYACAAGCSSTADGGTAVLTAVCAVSSQDIGAACPAAWDGARVACGAVPDSQIVCTGGKWAQVPCPRGTNSTDGGGWYVLPNCQGRGGESCS